MDTRHVFAPLLALAVLVACGPQQADSDTRADPATSANTPSSTSSSTAPGTESERTSRIRIEVEGEPTVGEATVLVYLLEEGGEGVSGAQVEITGDMTHAGMMPVVATATEAEPGLYRTEDFRFTMAGDWILTAEIELPGGSTATTERFVTVASP